MGEEARLIGGGGSRGGTCGLTFLLFLIMADGLTFSLDRLINNPQFDFLMQFHQGNPMNEDVFFNFVDVNDSPYDSLNMSSSYLDETELILSKKNSSDLSFYSLNIQSLPAKFNEFCEHLCILSDNNCSPDIICLQETWRIVDPAIFSIP